MTEITKQVVWKFFIEEMNKNTSLYIDCGEILSTPLAENAQDHFNCMTEMGDSPIEQEIFEWAHLFTEKFAAEDFIHNLKK